MPRHERTSPPTPSRPLRGKRRGRALLLALGAAAALFLLLRRMQRAQEARRGAANVLAPPYPAQTPPRGGLPGEERSALAAAPPEAPSSTTPVLERGTAPPSVARVEAPLEAPATPSVPTAEEQAQQLAELTRERAERDREDAEVRAAERPARRGWALPLASAAAFVTAVALTASLLGGYETSPSPSRRHAVAPQRGAGEAAGDLDWAALGARFDPTCSFGSLIGTLVDEEVAARARPVTAGPVIETFPRINALGNRQVFLLEDEVPRGEGASWFRALLPIRPNGTRGFIPEDAVRLSTTSYRLVLERDRFRLSLFEGCRLVKQYRVGIGTGETPTPVGRFYLASLLKLPDPDTIYGTYAYGLSAYSEVLTDWELGGIVGLHGTNLPSSIGKRSSHGCIRMRNRDIEELVELLPLGTPIEIVDALGATSRARILQ